MDNPTDAQTGQGPTSAETAASLFDDITNPAVENALATGTADGGSGSGSIVESHIPKPGDFKVENFNEPTKVDLPVQPAAQPAAQPAVQQPAVPAQQQPAAATPAVQPAANTPSAAGQVPPAGTPAAPQQPVLPTPTPEQMAQFYVWQAQQGQGGQQQQPVQQQPVQQQPQQPRPLTQQEIDQATARYRVTEQDFDALFNETDKTKAIGILDGMLQNVVRQAVTTANHLIQDQGAKVQQMVQPYMSFADTQREHMLREQFFTSNPDLRGQDVLITAVMGQMTQAYKAGQYRPASDQQLFQDVATRTKALIAQWQQQGQQLPAGQPGAQPQGQPAAQPASAKPAMAVLPTTAPGGGQSSAGAGQAAPGQNPTAVALFG